MKYQLTRTLLLTLFMSFLMSVWITWINLGVTRSFVNDWFKAFILAWPAAFLIVFILMKPVDKLTSKILNKAS